MRKSGALDPAAVSAEASAGKSARAGLRDAGLVFAVAFLVRALFLFSTLDRVWPHSALYEGDAPVWARWAQALSRGEPFEFDLPMRTPGVAFLLSAAGAVAPPFTLLKLAWCAISAATCAALFLAVRRELSARAAWIAAGLACFSFGSYQLATSLNSEAPYALLVVLLAGATARWVRSPRWPAALALGVLHGAALLLRAEHLLLLALFLAWSALASRTRRGLGLAAATLAVALAVCLPWAVRSHAATVRFNTVETRPVDFTAAQPPWSPEAQAFLRGLPAFAREGNFNFVQHLARQSSRQSVERADLEHYFESRFAYVPEPLAEWTLCSSKGALDFALANHPASEGGFSRAGLFDGTDAAPEFAFGRPSHLRLYNHGYSAAWQWIRRDPGAWLALCGKKLERFAAGAALGWSAQDLPYGRASRRWPVDLATPLKESAAWRWGILAAALAGLALAARTDLGALCALALASKLAVTVLFYGYARQAVSIQPLLYVFVAVAIDAALSRAIVPPRAARLLGIALALAFLGVDVASFAGENNFDVKPADPALLAPAPQWGPSAFECAGELEITPR